MVELAAELAVVQLVYETFVLVGHSPTRIAAPPNSRQVERAPALVGQVAMVQELKD